MQKFWDQAEIRLKFSILMDLVTGNMGKADNNKVIKMCCVFQPANIMMNKAFAG